MASRTVDILSGFVGAGGIENVGNIIATRRAQQAAEALLGQQQAAPQASVARSLLGGVQGGLAQQPQAGSAPALLGGPSQIQNQRNQQRRQQLQLFNRVLGIASIPGGQQQAQLLLSKVGPEINKNFQQFNAQAGATVNRAAQILQTQGEQAASLFLDAARQSNELSPEVRAMLPNPQQGGLGQKIQALQGALDTSGEVSKALIGDQFSPVKVQQFGATDLLTQGSQVSGSAPAQRLLLGQQAQRRKETAQVIENRGLSSTDDFQKAAAKELGQSRAKARIKLETTADSALLENAKLDRMEALIDDANVGPGASFINAAQRFASAVGAKKFDKNIAATEVLNSLFKEQVLDKAAALTGAISDKDIALLEEAAGGIQQTPQGLRELIRLRKLVNERAIAIDRFLGGDDRIDQSTKDKIRQFGIDNPLVLTRPTAQTQESPPTSNVLRARNAAGQVIISTDNGQTWQPEGG